MIGGTNVQGAINAEDDEFFESQHGSRAAKRDPSGSRVSMPNDQDPDYWTHDYGAMKFRSMPFDVELFGGWFRFNPVVFFVSVGIIIGFIIYCNADPPVALAEIKEWKTFITDNFTWLYIASVGVFLIFDCYLMMSRFGGVVLGPPGEPPRFSTASWFAMLFSAGIGIGLFYFGVSEPIYHYVGGARWQKLPRFERAIAAMNVSWFHWGLAPSACYSIVGLPIAYYAHRLNMPCSMRTVFYPLMGNSIHGIIGDLIDIFAVMGTIFGIGTSLGLGVDTIAAGLHRVFEDDFENTLDAQKAIIWVVTLFATISVATGLDYGIRRLSEGNFLLGLFVLGVLAMAGDTFYLLDLFVETAGHHIWSLMDLEFHTDAFADNSRIVGDDKLGWMDGWTVFYWGWWISWAPFVGVFIAQISKGRTVREFILGNVFVPSLLTSAWFTIYGGLGLEMEMRAETAGIGGNYHALRPETKHAMYDRPFNSTDPGNNGYANEEFYTLTDATAVPPVYTKQVGFVRETYYPAEYDYAYNKPICPAGGVFKVGKIARLSCQPHADRLWDVIEANSFGMEKFVSFVTVIAVITYFITSSDSGSMVVDMLCSNGLQEPPLLQRIFWGIAEGAVAFSLLEAGGNDAIKALQTASIAAGLPFCVIMIGMMISTYQMFIDMEKDDPDFMKTQQAQSAAYQKENGQRGEPKRWKRRVLEYVNQTIMGALCCGKPNILETGMAIVAPFMVDFNSLTRAGLNPMFGVITAGVFFFGFVLFHILEAVERGMFTFAWMCYFIFVGVTAMNRSVIRNKFNLRGDAMCDCCIVFWCYPCAVLQLQQEVEELMTESENSKAT